ncbi:hypothetical protein ABZ917_35775 [Nonomuraea wenchangensis]
MRELRAPLAAGYLWLAFAWLVWARHLPEPGQASGLLADLYKAAEAIGLTGVAIATSFAAYLIGIISVSVSSRISGFFAFFYAKRVADAIRGLVYDTGITIDWKEEKIIGLRGGPLMQLYHISRVTFSSSTEPRVWALLSFRGELLNDLSRIPMRLLGQDQELYGAHDRLEAEADFRTGSGVPLFALAVATYTQIDHSAGWALAATAVIIFDSGIKRSRSAFFLLVHAIKAGRATSLFLENAQEHFDRLLREEESRAQASS